MLMTTRDQQNANTLCAETLADHAVAALIAELELYPKPGLVSPVDSGSHQDMDHALLRASARGLHRSFQELAQLGAGGASFDSGLVPLGRIAERRMMEITRGVNTHRGAIFSMGLLVAATASLGTPPYTSDKIRSSLVSKWGNGLKSHAEAGAQSSSHGSLAARSSGVGGARQEAALGFPSIFDLALPHFTLLEKHGFPFQEAAIETLFLLMSLVPDTNIFHRGGEEGARFVMSQSRLFLEAGGIKNRSWRDLACQIHKEFVARNLSPGGSADLLAGTFFLFRVTSHLPGILTKPPEAALPSV